MPEYDAERITKIAEKMIAHLQEENVNPADVLCALFRATVCALSIAPHKDLERARELYNAQRTMCLNTLSEMGWE